jgi:uncharacterized protein YfaS (alpha-2-macroglobulin family)
MPTVSPRVRLIRAAILAAALAGLAALPLKTPTPQRPAPPAWTEVDRLVREQKYQEASRVVERLLEAAKQTRDEAEWTKALVRMVQLQIGMHGDETAVRFLKDQPWPTDLSSRTVLELFYAQTLVTYSRMYSFEVAQRERVESTGVVDLKAWTREQIYDEAVRAYVSVWQQRDALGGEKVAAFSEFVRPNDYPAGIRDTVRDAVSYFFVDLLADTSGWGPEQSNAVFALDLASLLRADAASTASVRLDDPSNHPLVRLVAVLADLESWHAGRGEREAAFEARLERTRRLYYALSAKADHDAIERDLEARLPGMADLPWFAMGKAQLALFLRQALDGDLVRARGIAEEGYREFPTSTGGRLCLSIVGQIEAPDYQLRVMQNDGPGRRSVLVSHRNVARLIFRAYPIDLPARVASATDLQQVLPTRQEMEALFERTAAAEWSVALPPTPDYRSHQTFVTPPLVEKGFYVLAASGGDRFGSAGFSVVAANFLVSDLVLLIPQATERGRGGTNLLELEALSGETGRPVEGASIELWRALWNPVRMERIGHAHTDSLGRAVLGVAEETVWGAGFLFARKGADLAFDTNASYGNPPEAPEKAGASLVFTDRSIYRPGQKILWKVLSYRGDATHGKLAVSPDAAVTIRLIDQNNQEIESRSATTNSFGSVAGEFSIPFGRALGAWRVEATPSGSASVRVEEYKRPTFEVTLKDPSEPLRLNRPARLTGEARYYFGLPVASGSVRWRVTRTPVYPWWFWWTGWAAGRTETMAVGTSALRADGGFTLAFTPKADERLAGETRALTYSYQVDADAADAGGETRSASRTFRLGFVSIEARFEMPNGFVREGAVEQVKIVRTSLDGVPRAGRGSWRIFRLEQPGAARLPAEEPLDPGPPPLPGSYRTAGDALRARWQTSYDPERVMAHWSDGPEVARGDLTHDTLGTATLPIRDLPPGAYRIRYSTKDEFGADYEAPKAFLVAGRRTSLELPAVLIAESTSVEVGGTARLLAASGLPGQRMELEIDRDGRSVERRVLIAGESPAIVEIPIEGKDRGGFGVKLTVLADHQLMTLTQSVFVPWDDKKLEVSFTTFRDLLRPGQRETWTVRVKDGDGGSEAAAAEILAYMYDRSLDALIAHSSPDPIWLYPYRTAVAWSRATLGEAYFAPICGSFPVVPWWPGFYPDALKFYDGYAIGGPGRRGGVMGRVLADSLSVTEGVTVAGEEPLMNVAAKAAPKSVAGQAEPRRAEPAPAPVATRSQFSETAFWQPSLRTGKDGSASIEFTVPDSVTAWNVWVTAVTRDLKSGTAKKEARSVKDLMVRPYVPRFLREGDQADLKIVVNNASGHGLSGSVRLEILDTGTNASALADFGLAPDRATRPFSAEAGSGADVGFRIAAPRRGGSYAIRATAVAGDFSDGELRPVPVLPSRLELSQSRFAALRRGESRTLHFADLASSDDPSRVDEQLVVTVDGQLFYSVLSALPYLVNYPYECTEQILNRFLSTGIVSSVFRDYPAVAAMAKELSRRDTRLERFDADDPNRRMALEETPWLEVAGGGARMDRDLVRVLDPRIAKADRETALAKLRQTQADSGAFPWWPGGPPSPYMTLYVLEGFGRALEFGVEVPKDMAQAAWRYVGSDLKKDLEACMLWNHDLCYEATLVNYALSSYPDASWYGPAIDDTFRGELLAYSFGNWRRHSPYLKGQLALTLERMGHPADAKLVWDSVMDSAKTDRDLGTYFAPEDRSWLWYNDTVETQAFALRVLAELDPADPRRHGLVQWLFLNKKMNQWKSTRATAEAIYALVWYLKKEGALSVREDVTVDVASQKTTFVFEPDRYTGKRNQVVVPGEKIDRRRDSEIAVSKRGEGLAFASATWHFSTERLPDEDRGDFFSVSRRYFLREASASGFVLKPLADGTIVNAGDEIEVQLSIRSKHAAEYVHLRDPRPAGAEPENALSRYRWHLGISWYEQTRDSGTDFFFETLPVGEYPFRYRLRANMAGTFRVGPATIQSMYAPEFSAYSAGATLTIR